MNLFDILQRAIETQTLLYAVLSRPITGSQLQKITIRPIFSKQGVVYQVSEQRGSKVFHRNILPDLLASTIDSDFSKLFHNAIYYTTDADYHVLTSRKNKQTILRKRPTRQAEDLSHNRKKKHLLEEGVPIPFLIELGIMNSQGRVLPKKMDKFRQINRFLEFVDDIVDQLPKDRALNIIDFGCGKSYLTFALYEYLKEPLEILPKITGLDLKSDVISHCNALAKQLGYGNLQFQVGDIDHFTPTSSIDMVICLHACNTATDAALECAIRWNAKVIFAVPCCHHELYSQIQQPALNSLLRHGILKERLAALVTDAARADLLESKGYQTQIIEFIDLEHTPKNLLIRAIKGNSKENEEAALTRYRQLKETLHISPSLEKRL